MVFQLYNGAVYDFVVQSEEGSKSPTVFRNLLLTLPVKDVKENSPKEETEALNKVLNVLRCRFARLQRRQQAKKWFQSNPSARAEVFFDLNDFPVLIREHESQSSGLSQRTDSQRSTLELEVPSHGAEQVEEEENADGADASEVPAKRKLLGDLQVRSQYRRTDKIYSKVLESAEEEGMEPTKFIAMLGHRASYKSDRRVASQFQNIVEGKSGPQEVDLELAIFLKSHLQIGRDLYTDLRLLLKDKVIFPPMHRLNENIGSFLPDLSFTENTLHSDLKETLFVTVRRALLASISPDSDTAGQVKSLGLIAKVRMGIDGSGNHSVFNTESTLAEGVTASHVVVGGFTVLSLQVDDLFSPRIYSDPSPCNAESERPLFLQTGRETTEVMARMMAKIDPVVDQLCRSQSSVPCDELGNVQVQFEVEMSQLDGKALQTISGLGGAYCTACTVMEKDAKVPQRISEGFSLDRNIADLHQLFDTLRNEDDTITTVAGDYCRRFGLTHKPQTEHLEILHNFPITHSYIRVLSHFENLIYRVNGNVRKMGKGQRLSDLEKKRVLDAKNLFRERAQKGPLHLKIDCPDSCGAGGSTDTAELARKFFRVENIVHILDLVEGRRQEKESIRVLHRQFSVILRVVSSKQRQVDVDSFQQLCTETYLFLVQEFPWATVPSSIHRLLGHSADRIRLNEGHGLGLYSEEALESMHKYVRRFKVRLARPNSLENNLRDTFKQLWVRSDPVIRSKRRILECSLCSKEGHTRRSCPDKKVREKSSYDELVEEFFL